MAVVIGSDGVLTFTLRVTAAAGVDLGTVRYTAAVVITGYHDGEPGHIVANIPHHSLTVGQSPVEKREKREQWLHHIAPEDVKLIRRTHLVLTRASEADAVAQLIEGMRRAGELWDEADALYKKVKDSELGKAIALAAA